MISNKLTFIVTLCILSVSINCSKSSNSTTAASTYTNNMSSNVTTLNSKINGAAGIADTTFITLRKSTRGNTVNALASFSSAWTTTTPGIQDPSTDTSSTISFKDYFETQLNPDLYKNGAAVNAFGRMKNALQIFCAVGIGATAAGSTPDSNGYLAVGTYTVTFSAGVKAAMQSSCGIDTSTIPNDTAMTMTITAGTTNYDLKLAFDFFDQTYWVKNDSTVLRVATAEDNSSSGYSRTLVEYNKSTGVTRAEAVYVTAPSASASVEAYRIYSDETNDVGMVMAFRGSSTGQTSATRYILSGKPSSGDAISVSLRSDTAFGNSNSYEACILSADLSIDTDGSRCTATSSRLNGADITATATNSLFTSWFDDYVGTGLSANWGTAGLTDADVISFTDTTNLSTTGFAP